MERMAQIVYRLSLEHASRLGYGAAVEFLFSALAIRKYAVLRSVAIAISISRKGDGVESPLFADSP